MIFSILIFSFFFLFSIGLGNEIQRIPEAEKVRIERMFSFLVWDEGFAYVLFGSKPMSVVSQDKTVPEYYGELYQTPLLELEALWKVWERYADLFPMKDFVFVTESNERRFNLYLLNKISCLRVIEDNLSIFQKRTGISSSEDIFRHLVSTENLFKMGLHNSQALYGILLGYGRENAVGFENYYSEKKDPLPASVKHINDDSGPFMLPSFASFSEEETKALIGAYKKEREEITKLFSDKNFLEVTLHQLTK